MSNARFSILQARAINDKRISDAQFRTLAALGMYADREGWCFPSLTRIGADCNKSKQAAGRDIIHLKKCGYIDVYPQFDKSTGSRRPNKYRLKFDTPVNMDDSTPSTPDVDTPSTPDVDVNVPNNVPNNNGHFSTAYARGEQERPDKVSQYLQLANAPGMKQQVRIDAILSYLGESFNVQTERKDWKAFAKHIYSCQIEKGWDVAQFVKWLKAKPDFNIDYWSAARMQERYAQAFDQPKLDESRTSLLRTL